LYLLSPFLEVIRSEETSGPITGVALEAVHKILLYDILSHPVFASPQAICGIAKAVTACR